MNCTLALGARPLHRPRLAQAQARQHHAYPPQLGGGSPGRQEVSTCQRFGGSFEFSLWISISLFLLRYLAERLAGDRTPSSERSSMRKGRRDSNTSVASTLSQLGERDRIQCSIQCSVTPCHYVRYSCHATTCVTLLSYLNRNFRSRGSLDAGELLERPLVDVRLRQESLLFQRLRRQPAHLRAHRTGGGSGVALCLQPQLAARDHRGLDAVLALHFVRTGLSPHALRSFIAGGKFFRTQTVIQFISGRTSRQATLQTKLVSVTDRCFIFEYLHNISTDVSRTQRNYIQRDKD